MVFISYSSIDYNTASNIRSILNQNEIECWMAPESIPAGSDYGEEIPTAIENCDAFVLILSENSQNSKWVPKEIDLAITNDKIIIPLHIDDKQLNKSFNFRLTNTQRIEAYQQNASAFDELIKRIYAISGIESSVKSDPKPAAPVVPIKPVPAKSTPKNWPNIFVTLKNTYTEIRGFRQVDLNDPKSEELFKKLRRHVAPYASDETPLFGYDPTLLNTGKEGYLVTDKKLYVKHSFGVGHFIFSHSEVIEWTYKPATKNPVKECHVCAVTKDNNYYFAYAATAVEAEEFCKLLTHIQRIALS